MAARQAASVRAASIASAHTASQIVSIVAVLAADQPAAVAVALAVVSDALNVRSCHSPADGTAVIDLVRRLIEPGIPVVFDAHPAPWRKVPHPPALLPASRADSQPCVIGHRVKQTDDLLGVNELQIR
jgi:hypothetical protein